MLKKEAVKLVVFISGRGSNMSAIFKQCKTGILKDKAVITLVFSDKVGAPGVQAADRLGITTASIDSKGYDRTEYDQLVIELLDNIDFDYIVLAGYMRILSKPFVKKYRRKIINIHPADTKEHKGLHAYEWAFSNKIEQTYITVHYVDEGVDTGPIIGQKEVDLSNAKTLKAVEKAGLKVEHTFYSEMLLKVIESA